MGLRINTGALGTDEAPTRGMNQTPHVRTYARMTASPGITLSADTYTLTWEISSVVHLFVFSKPLYPG